MTYLLKNCKCLEGTKNILIKDGKITYIGNESPASKLVYDLNNQLVLPGMIDPHVHVRDLQQSDKEEWLSASKAAINGGVTTISDMPNTIPPTTDFAGLIEKQKAMKKSLVNSYCYLGATNENAAEIEKILDEKPYDVKGIKIFLSASSQNEIINEAQLEIFFQIALKYDAILLFHNELQSVIDKFSYKYKHNILNHNNLRNREAAVSGMKLILKLQKKYPAKVYICHVSTAEEMELIKTYKPNYPLFCEITPHHLLLNETILPKVGNVGKVNPPLRTEKNNEALWQAIDDRIVDCFGSDHAPHLKSEKEQEYENAPSGFPGLETSLPVLLATWKQRKMDLQKLVQLTSENAAKIFNIEKRGKIAEDYFADLVVIDENEKTVIQAENFQSKAKYSPFEGWEIPYRIQKTIVNGKMYEISKKIQRGKMARYLTILIVLSLLISCSVNKVFVRDPVYIAKSTTFGYDSDLTLNDLKGNSKIIFQVKSPTIPYDFVSICDSTLSSSLNHEFEDNFFVSENNEILSVEENKLSINDFKDRFSNSSWEYLVLIMPQKGFHYITYESYNSNIFNDTNLAGNMINKMIYCLKFQTSLKIVNLKSGTIVMERTCDIDVNYCDNPNYYEIAKHLSKNIVQSIKFLEYEYNHRNTMIKLESYEEVNINEFLDFAKYMKAEVEDKRLDYKIKTNNNSIYIPKTKSGTIDKSSYDDIKILTKDATPPMHIKKVIQLPESHKEIFDIDSP